MNVDLLGDRMTIKVPPVPMKVVLPTAARETTGTYVEETVAAAKPRRGLFSLFTKAPSQA